MKILRVITKVMILVNLLFMLVALIARALGFATFEDFTIVGITTLFLQQAISGMEDD